MIRGASIVLGVMGVTGLVAVGQGSVLRWSASTSEGRSTSEARIVAGSLMIQEEWSGPNQFRMTYGANITDLDLSRIVISRDRDEVATSAKFPCRRERPNCWRRTGFTHVGRANDEPSGNVQSQACERVMECETFVGSIRSAAGHGAGGPAETTSRRASSTASVPAAADGGAGAQRLNGSDSRRAVPQNSTGSSAANKAEPALKRLVDVAVSDRGRQNKRPQFAAFARSEGQNANAGTGVAVGSDMNGTVSAAHANCELQSHTLCGDSGLCMLHHDLPGRWVAFATDGRGSPGNMAYACAFPTEEAAAAQALAWCGGTCKVRETRFVPLSSEGR